MAIFGALHILVTRFQAELTPSASALCTQTTMAHVDRRKKAFRPRTTKCPHRGCSYWASNTSGLTRHIHATHTTLPRASVSTRQASVQRPDSPSATSEFTDVLNEVLQEELRAGSSNSNEHPAPSASGLQSEPPHKHIDARGYCIHTHPYLDGEFHSSQKAHNAAELRYLIFIRNTLRHPR